jgi:hypothetical protein
MDKIYLKDNYIVTELSGVTAVFGKNYTVYSENTTTFFLNSSFPINNARSVTIDFSRSSTIFNEAGTVAYTTATLRSFFLANTGFKSPVGGSTGITVGTTPITSGVDGRVLFQSGGVVSQDSGFTWDNTNKRLGILNSSPIYKLDVNGNANFEGNTRLGVGFQLHFNNNNVGLYRDANTLRLGGFGGIQFLSSATNINSQTIRMQLTDAGQLVIGATTAGARLDVRAQGALSTDIAFRVRNSADTLNIIKAQGDGNVFVGIGAGNSSTGANVTALGVNSLRNNTSGSHNTSFGHTALFSITTAVANTAMGSLALTNLTSGDNNIAFGFNSGRYISSGANLTISNSSLFIGNGTRPNADNQTNQIVIGNGATGLGSNTVVLGNDSIVTTQLRGTVRLSLQASAPAGVEGAIYYDSTTKKHYGHNGTTWNALY